MGRSTHQFNLRTALGCLRLAVVVFILAAPVLGCRGLTGPSRPGRILSPLESEGNRSDSSPNTPEKGSMFSDSLEDLFKMEILEDGPGGKKITKLVPSEWRLVEPDNPNDYRWRNEKLEDYFKLPRSRRPALRQGLNSKNRLLAATAAIGLARSGSEAEFLLLPDMIYSTKLPISVRRAAIETVARSESPLANKLLDEFFGQFASSGDKSSVYNSALYSELLLSLSDRADPANDERLIQALESSQFDVQRTALKILGESKLGSLPPEAFKLLRDSNPGVRAAAIKAVAASGSENALEAILTALKDERTIVRTAALEAAIALEGDRGSEAIAVAIKDKDPKVRIAALNAVSSSGGDKTFQSIFSALQASELEVRQRAIAALGRSGEEKARDALLKIVEQEKEFLRGSAILALAEFGDIESVCKSASDPHYYVRKNVAKSLAKNWSPGCVETARKLIADSSLEVQRNIIASIGGWPLEFSGPLLLEAALSRTWKAREGSLETLSEKWPPAAEVRLTGRREDDQQIINSLKQRWEQQFGAAAITRNKAFEEAGPPKLSPARLNEIAQQMEHYLRPHHPAERVEAVERLLEYGPELPAALEILLGQSRSIIDEAFYLEVLAEVSPAFAALRDIGNPDLKVRRRALATLEQLARARKLSPLVIHRLAETVDGQEKDMAIWRSLFVCIENQTGDSALQIAEYSLKHPFAQIRSEGCAVMEKIDSPRCADSLTPLLFDSDSSVCVAAAKALGHCRQVEDIQPLANRLTASNPKLRIEAAAALFRLSDPRGETSLLQMARDSDVGVRRLAAQIMGDLGSMRFAPSLIQMLDDQASVRRIALLSLPKVAGENIAQTSNLSSLSTSEKIKLWKEWFQKQ